MKCSYDKTFTLTTSNLQAPTVQSALGISLVRSVECGLFAQLAFGFFAKKSRFFSVNPKKEISNAINYK